MKIIRWDGKPITKPGIYSGIPIDKYHSPICDGPEISSTGLRAIILDSALHYWDTSYLNPNRAPDDPTAVESVYFRIGRASHTLMLEPQKFERLYTKRPKEFDSWRTQASRDWRDAAQTKGWTVLSEEEWLQVEGIARALHEHRWHAQGIIGGLIETSMIARDPKTGIWLKSRPDSFPLDSAFTDLKITTSAKPVDAGRSTKRLGYDIQMALAGVCLYLLTGRTIDQFWLIFCESKRPHAIHVSALGLAQIYWSRIRIRGALDKLAQCLKENYWPSYDMDGADVLPTKWEAEDFEAQQKAGLLPKEDAF